MNGMYQPSPEHLRHAPQSVGGRLRVTGLAELLVFTATNKYVKVNEALIPAAPETSANRVALGTTVDYVASKEDVNEGPAPLSGYRLAQTSEMTQEEMGEDARKRIEAQW